MGRLRAAMGEFKRGDIVEYVPHDIADEPPAEYEPAVGSLGVVTGVSPPGNLIINWIVFLGPPQFNKAGMAWSEQNFIKIGETKLE